MNRRLTLPLALALLALTPQAHADEDDLNQASKKVFQEARAAAEREDWALCRTRAVGVWQQVKSANVAGILGICEAELGMNREAAAHLEFFLEKQTKATPKQIAEVKKSLDKVLPKVAKLTVLPSPDDSDVFVDDVLVGRGRQTVFLNPGDARIGAAKDGQSITKTVTVKAGEVIGEYRIEVPKEPGGVGAGGAGAGGAGAGGAGGAGEGAGGAGAGGSGGGPAGEDAPVWPTFVLAGVGVASLGLGVTFTALSTQKASEIDEATRCPDPVSPVCLQDVDDLRSSGAGFQVGAIVGFVVGGLAGAGALTYALVSTSDDTPGATVTMLPRFGLDSAGFSVLGSF